MTCHQYHKTQVKESKKIGVWKLTSVLSLIVATFFMEVCSYYGSNSCIILSDAIHNLSDGGAVFISLIAVILSYKAPTKKYTYGFARLQDIAALVNNSTTLVSAVLIIWKSLGYLRSGGHEVTGNRIFFIGVVSFICNGISYLIMTKTGVKNTNLNIRSLNLHLLGDIFGSLSTICAGITVHITGSARVDPIISIILSTLIIKSGWYLFKETCKLFMNSVPEEIDLKKIERAIMCNNNIISMHELHVFANGDDIHLTVHIVSKDIKALENTLIKINHNLKKLNVSHISMQQETIGYKCDSWIYEESKW